MIGDLRLAERGAFCPTPVASIVSHLLDYGVASFGYAHAPNFRPNLFSCSQFGCHALTLSIPRRLQCRDCQIIRECSILAVAARNFVSFFFVLQAGTSLILGEIHALDSKFE
jgi:hypothetical protein